MWPIYLDARILHRKLLLIWLIVRVNIFRTLCPPVKKVTTWANDLKFFSSFWIWDTMYGDNVLLLQRRTAPDAQLLQAQTTNILYLSLNKFEKNFQKLNFWNLLMPKMTYLACSQMHSYRFRMSQNRWWRALPKRASWIKRGTTRMGCGAESGSGNWR